jgi:putative oxidoreductase
MQTTKTTQLQAWGITLLRAVTGIIFLGAGVQNFFLQDSSELPRLIVVVGSLVELTCGAALVVGLFTRWVSMALALLMLANILAIHPPSGFLVGDAGFEHALLRLAANAALALAGPGKAALDNMVASRSGPK